MRPPHHLEIHPPRPTASAAGKMPAPAVVLPKGVVSFSEGKTQASGSDRARATATPDGRKKAIGKSCPANRVRGLRRVHVAPVNALLMSAYSASSRFHLSASSRPHPCKYRKPGDYSLASQAHRTRRFNLDHPCQLYCARLYPLDQLRSRIWDRPSLRSNTSEHRCIFRSPGSHRGRQAGRRLVTELVEVRGFDHSADNFKSSPVFAESGGDTGRPLAKPIQRARGRSVG